MTDHRKRLQRSGTSLANVKSPTDQSTAVSLAPQMIPQPQAELHLVLDQIKKETGSGGHSTITVTCDVMCFSTWLLLAKTVQQEADQAITNYFTWVLNNRTCFSAEQVS